MRPSSTKSSPSSGSITFVSASWTSSTVGIDYRVVGSKGYAAAGPDCALHRRPDRRAVRDPQGRRRHRRGLDDPAAGGRFGARIRAAPLAGPDGLAALQRGALGRPDAAPRGDGRRARDLRRRLPDHARVPDGHRRADPPDPAEPRRGAAVRRPPARPAGTSRDAARPARTARAVSGEAFALSFFDPDRDLYGIARSGSTILFEGRTPAAHAGGPELEADGDGWRARLPRKLSPRLGPASAELDLGGVTARVCRVSGEASGRSIACLGTFSTTTVTPRWEEL